MTFAELVLFMFSVSIALQILYYLQSEEPYTKVSASYVRQNVITYVVILVSSFIVKCGPQLMERIVGFVNSVGNQLP